MIPRKPLIVLTVVLALNSAIVSFAPALSGAWLLIAGIFFFIAIIDALLCIRIEAPNIERSVPGSMSLMSWIDVGLTIRNDVTRRSLKVEIFDHHPQSFTTDGLPLSLVVPAEQFVNVKYRARPMERGPKTFSGCDFRIASPLGLWWRLRKASMTSQVHVYPNYSTISKLLAYAVDDRLQLAGVRLSRRRGEGIEFHQLRDYREGDSLRSIDWKATARMGRLIAREYQDERDQQVVFVLDAGRRMLAKDADISHFDHTLNAMLLLSYVALGQGDAVGIMTVGATRTWLPPRKGADAINGLLNHVYDIQPHTVEVDYAAAATSLAIKQRRRSLIVFLTNVREEDSQDLQTATDLLNRRHLVILASLRERALDDTLAKNIHSFDDAVLFAATNQYLDSRRESHKLLRAKGVFVEDCLSDELPSAITNRYLAIKRAGIL